MEKKKKKESKDPSLSLLSEEALLGRDGRGLLRGLLVLLVEEESGDGGPGGDERGADDLEALVVVLLWLRVFGKRGKGERELGEQNK